MFKHVGHMSVVSALLLATVFGQLTLTADASVYRAQSSWWDVWFPLFSDSSSTEVQPIEDPSTDLVEWGNSFSSDYAVSSVQSGYCGDGVTNWELGEQCDDYNTNDGDGCTSSCQSEYCGDGTCNNAENATSCMSDCPSVCGNWTTEGSETCDDGNTNDGDGCTSSCQSEYCGDGICNNGETTSWCMNDCPATCGNWTTEGSEACDDGNTNDGDGCSAACATESCGDGTQQANEECDDGNVNDNDGCSALCKRERCGDAIIQNGETCDEGDLNAASCDPPYSGGCGYCDVVSCEQIRVEGPRCGDGVTQYAYEQCDDGNEDFSDGCVACKVAQCGDGYLYEGSEECDDGNILNDDGCSGFCTREDFYCGDGKVQGAEQCDPGTKCSITGVDCRPGVVPCPGGDEDVCEFSKNSGCDYGCSLICGNGVIDEGETCDLGSECADTGVDCSAVEYRPCDKGSQCKAVHTPNCYYCQKAHYAAPGYSSYQSSSVRSSFSRNSADIFSSVCGNGIREAGEQCDDGNTEDGDGCSWLCEKSYACGDGMTEEGEEECDDGNLEAGDGCNEKCKKEYCGNQTTEVGEECDAGKRCLNAEVNYHCRTDADCGEQGPCVTMDIDGCSHECKWLCGDTLIYPGEECDDGNRDDGDGCSSDCKIECGNGAVDPGEVCDDGKHCAHGFPCNTDADCADNQFDSSCKPRSGDGCSDVCKYEHVCGDRIIDEGNEQCDADVLLFTDCADDPQIGQVFNAGTLSCNEDCTLNTSDCSRCGDRVIEGSETCDDGNTENNDGCSSKCRTEKTCVHCFYGNEDDLDAHCASKNPFLCSIPSCNDGIDNDGDGTADYGGTFLHKADEGCESVRDDDESIEKIRKNDCMLKVLTGGCVNRFHNDCNELMSDSRFIHVPSSDKLVMPKAENIQDIPPMDASCTNQIIEFMGHSDPDQCANVLNTIDICLIDCREAGVNATCSDKGCSTLQDDARVQSLLQSWQDELGPNEKIILKGRQNTNSATCTTQATVAYKVTTYAITRTCGACHSEGIGCFPQPFTPFDCSKNGDSLCDTQQFCCPATNGLSGLSSLAGKWQSTPCTNYPAESGRCTGEAVRFSCEAAESAAKQSYQSCLDAARNNCDVWGGLFEATELESEKTLTAIPLACSMKAFVDWKCDTEERVDDLRDLDGDGIYDDDEW